MVKKVVVLVFVLLATVYAQQSPQSSDHAQHKNASKPKESQVVIVTGTFEPIPLDQISRSVVSFDTRRFPLLENSVVDYLDEDSSVDLESRAPDGVQSDLSIRGSAFGQSLVLLNGLRINDAQTGHHDMDIPVPLESLSRIEVLHGAGSTLYGSDASGGVVNFITGPPVSTEFRLRAGVGNFGFNQQRISGGLVGQKWSEQIAASRDFSTGFAPDRDYRSSAVSLETRFSTALGGTELLLAGSDRPFGADQFYGNFPSWERTKSWFASVNQDLGKNTDIAFGYRRHTDEFVLFRNNPAIYENNHASESWQAVVRRHQQFGLARTLTYGLDFEGDSIQSNNLGVHARNRGAGYVNLDVMYFHRLSFSAGGREEVFSGGYSQFSPAISAGLWLRSSLKLHASISHAFRLPTYTDLYYSDPANIGNPSLRPESSWDFETGLEQDAGRRVSAYFTVFHRREHNGIDYMKSDPAAPWQAENIANLVLTGVETGVRMRWGTGQQVSLGYMGIHADQQLAPGMTSKYVFQFPNNRGVATWTGQWRGWVASSSLGVIQRVAQSPYPLWDLAASRASGRIKPYLQLSNLSDTKYENIPGIEMPGRSVIVGVELAISELARKP
jgi:outer membrane cobalamin receptor